MKKRLLWGLLGLLLLPVVGAARLAFVTIRFLTWRPQVLLILVGLAVALSIENPIAEQLIPEGIGLLEHMILSWIGLSAGTLVVGHGIASPEMKSLWRRVR